MEWQRMLATWLHGPGYMAIEMQWTICLDGSQYLALDMAESEYTYCWCIILRFYFSFFFSFFHCSNPYNTGLPLSQQI